MDDETISLEKKALNLVASWQLTGSVLGVVWVFQISGGVFPSTGFSPRACVLGFILGADTLSVDDRIRCVALAL